ncbi:ADP-ribosyltransferase [Mycobacteroides sp. LB1]|uniref:ADP-ribosyltransferase n=1 Tax=Mycobacteroides sp. LB1 TaxID=2750814 RepID=UPI0021077686
MVAITTLVIGGAKIASDHTMPGTGFSTVQTAAADPTGPTGGPGDGGMNGGQFQPPGLPPQQPEYRGGNNLPPLDQNSGISIYNSGAPQAGQQPGGQQGGQPQQGAQQPQHGTQIPDYSTAPGYTQGPGRSNPDYQGPQQNSPQPQQPSQQQPTQPTHTERPTQTPTHSQQPTQSPTQTSSPNREDKQEQERDCQYISGMSSAVDGKITYSAPAEIAQKVANAAKKWNDLGGIQIVPASSNSSNKSSDHQHDNDNRSGQESQDDADSPVTLNISVIDDPNVGWGGRHTSRDDDSPAEILINLARMKDAGPGGMESVLGHELGHDLGLSDSVPGQLMAPSGPLPDGPQALDAQMLQQISTQGATQQCAAQNMAKALQEFWCPFGTNDNGSCIGAGVARQSWDFVSSSGQMVGGDVKELWEALQMFYRAIGNTDDGISRTALRQALGPLVGLGPNGSPSIGDAWLQLLHESGNQLIGWDDWFAGNYKKAAERVVATAFELAITMGAPGAAAKLLKWVGGAVRKVADVLRAVRGIGLTAKEVEALAKYTGDDFFKALNSALRDGQSLTTGQQELATNLSAALAKMPNYIGTVVRGFSHDPGEILAKYKPGQIVAENAFTSTDMIKPLPGNIVMTITSQTGKHIAEYSAYQGIESEVLFTQGTKFMVDAIQQVGKDGVNIVMHEVP